MRISVDERDSGYRTFISHGGHGTRWRVTLDGVEVKLCETADEELGEVQVCVVDDAGRMVVDGDRVAKRWLRGKVEITRA